MAPSRSAKQILECQPVTGRDPEPAQRRLRPNVFIAGRQWERSAMNFSNLLHWILSSSSFRWLQNFWDLGEWLERRWRVPRSCSGSQSPGQMCPLSSAWVGSLRKWDQDEGIQWSVWFSRKQAPLSAGFPKADKSRRSDHRRHDWCFPTEKRPSRMSGDHGATDETIRHFL